MVLAEVLADEDGSNHKGQHGMTWPVDPKKLWEGWNTCAERGLQHSGLSPKLLIWIATLNLASLVRIRRSDSPRCTLNRLDLRQQSVTAAATVTLPGSEFFVVELDLRRSRRHTVGQKSGRKT